VPAVTAASADDAARPGLGRCQPSGRPGIIFCNALTGNRR
jgi:hypothetical protein